VPVVYSQLVVLTPDPAAPVKSSAHTRFQPGGAGTAAPAVLGKDAKPRL